MGWLSKPKTGRSPYPIGKRYVIRDRDFREGHGRVPSFIAIQDYTFAGEADPLFAELSGERDDLDYILGLDEVLGLQIGAIVRYLMRQALGIVNCGGSTSSWTISRC